MIEILKLDYFALGNNRK